MKHTWAWGSGMSRGPERPAPQTSITIERPLEWMDTDAAGIWHYSTAIRFAEHAEMALHRKLGIIEQTFGTMPRAHVEFDFLRPVRFGDVVRTTVAVAAVGRSSVTYELTLAGEAGTFATGRIVTVLTGPEGDAMPLPDHLRGALTGAGGPP